MSRWLLGMMFAMALPLNAAIDVYQFEDPAQEARFRSLVEQLRCPKCQNQSIADSDADIARDMRARVATMIREGRSDEEIVGYFTARYGEFVNYRPPFRAETLVLWLGPAVVFLLGLALVVRQIVRGRRMVDDQEAP